MNKKMIAGLLSVMLILLSACSGGNATDAAKNDESGGYVQEFFSLPEAMTDYYTIARLADHTIRIIGTGGIYDSIDNGNTWVPYDYHSDLLDELTAVPNADSRHVRGQYAECIAIHTDGTVFVMLERWESDPDNEENYHSETISAVITPDGTETLITIDLPEQQETTGDWIDSSASSAISAEEELPAREDPAIDRTLTKAVFADDHRLIGTDIVTNELFVIDLTSGDILDTFYTSQDYIEEFAVYQNQLIVRTHSLLEVFDLETGEITATMPALEAFFNAERVGNFVFMPNETNEAFYVYESDGGIYKFTEAAAQAELLITAENNALANSDLFIDQILLLEDESFLVTADRAGEKNELIYFSYTEELPGPELSLTVYSLTEDYAVKRCVTNFQEQYPQYEVSYVYGRDDLESGMPLTDVLKNLNTEILAGTGPDIIMMDGIPIDSYVEKGALADLSDILAATDAEYFTNVLETYADSDGVYAVPTRFTVPVLMGVEEDLAQIDDISSLADFVKTTRTADSAEQMKYVMGELWPSELATYTLQSVSNGLLTEEGTVDEAKLRQYFSDLITIYENNETDRGDYYYSMAQYETEIFEENTWEDSDFNYEYDYYISITDRGAAWLEAGQNLLQAGNIMDMDSVLELITLQNDYGLSSQTAGAAGASSYRTMYTYAINGQTPHMDAAREFVAFLLSTDVQASDWSSGIPVSISAYDTSYQLKLQQAATAAEGYSVSGYGFEMEDGTYFDIDFSLDGVTAEDYEAVKELLLTADSAAVTDNIIVTSILRQAARCLGEQCSIDDAVAQILSDINLYLTE